MRTKLIKRLLISGLTLVALTGSAAAPALADINECHHVKVTKNGETVVDYGECNTIVTP